MMSGSRSPCSAGNLNLGLRWLRRRDAALTETLKSYVSRRGPAGELGAPGKADEVLLRARNKSAATDFCRRPLQGLPAARRCHHRDASMTSRPLSSAFLSTRHLLTSLAAAISSVHRPTLQARSAAVCETSLGCQSRSASLAPSTWRELHRKWPSPMGSWSSIPTLSSTFFTTCLLS
jgi:hypothetical protein